jgi:hypothetical protein
MIEHIEERLKTLKAEFKAGEDMLAELEARQSNIRVTMARISGAIQVLEELLNQEAPAGEPWETAATSETAAAA